MTEKEYEQKKHLAENIIKKAKSVNFELGNYLNTHIVRNDKNRTIMYTGVVTVLESFDR